LGLSFHPQADQSRLSLGAMTVDAYRALALLSSHPRIDARAYADSAQSVKALLTSVFKLKL
jgi:hypothetical protein